MDGRQARSGQFPPKCGFGVLVPVSTTEGRPADGGSSPLAVHFRLTNRGEYVFLQKNSECPHSRPGGLAPPLETVVGLHYAEQRGIEAVFILRQVKVQPQSCLVELQSEQLAC